MMERALKERIIGAAILVLFVVLVVPIFLDGPPDEAEIVSERVLLPGQDTQNTQTVVLDRNRTEPVPAAGNATASPQAATTPKSEPREKPPAQATPIVEKKPEPAPKAVTAKKEPVSETSVASETGMWAVQLGSFSNKENAEKLAADLRKQGYAAFLSQLATGSGQLHRVRIGPQKDRQSAEEIASRLLKAGHEGQVVPHP
jgi:DedD protein